MQILDAVGEEELLDQLEKTEIEFADFENLNDALKRAKDFFEVKFTSYDFCY